MSCYRWICKRCGQEVITAGQRPTGLRWTDGHTCSFVPLPGAETEDGRKFNYTPQAPEGTVPERRPVGTEEDEE